MAPESRDDFRVAIICALPLEADAVLDLFDQHYDNDGSKYGKQEGDTNTYTTGRFGPHDVVLVHMPGMGVNNASMVASKIRLSFRKINLGLVVGICGGAPLKQPIILGDVIISDSIVDFTNGRHYPDGIQARSGHLDAPGRPPPEIRGLLSKFATISMRQRLEDGIRQNLEGLCKKSNTARYPGVEHDRLFAASYRHMHRKETSPHECLCTLSRSNSDPVCSKALEDDCDALRCDVKALETPFRRDRLASASPAPLVHIGTVATTTVMKSGEHRERIASKNNIIAFEMEGAGVWEHLPCIIIKGVCDYADSHKNKKWQDYAAATAASAARAFLHLGIPEQQHSTATEGSSRKRLVFSGDREDASISKRLRQQSLSELQGSVSGLSRPDETSPGISSIPEQAGFDARKALLDALNFEQLDARHATIKAAHATTCE
jgi:nucleoside phosphorylase